MGKNKGKGSAYRVALPAVLGALALVMLYLASAMPTGVWGWTAVAGLGPLATVASLGVRSGFLCWGGVSILAFLLVPDKFCAMLFAALFGLYPMVKALAERVKPTVVKYAAKLAFFNLALTAIFAVMGTLVMASLPARLGELPWWLFYAIGNFVFVIYDLGLTRLIPFYLYRVDRAVRKGAR